MVLTARASNHLSQYYQQRLVSITSIAGSNGQLVSLALLAATASQYYQHCWQQRLVSITSIAGSITSITTSASIKGSDHTHVKLNRLECCMEVICSQDMRYSENQPYKMDFLVEKVWLDEGPNTRFAREQYVFNDILMSNSLLIVTVFQRARFIS